MAALLITLLMHFRQRMLPCSRGNRALAGLSLVCLLFVPGFANAQRKFTGRIIDQPPSDHVVLNAANDNTVVVVEPIRFPDRKIPVKPNPSEKLVVKLAGEPTKYEVLWKDIERIDLYEVRVRQEAEKLTKDGKLDEAYEYIAFLLQNYPKTPGLATTRQTYLYMCAADMFKKQQLPQALAIAEELHSLNPAYRSSASAPPLTQVMGSILDKMVAKYVAAEDFLSARTLLSRVAKQYNAADEPFVKNWIDQFAKQAAKHRDAASAALAKQEYVQAYDSWAQMHRIWPEVEGAAALTAEMERSYPLVVVGVTHTARRFVAQHAGDIAPRRASRLVDRTLLEFVGLGTEGGRYTCPWGDWKRREDGLKLTLIMANSDDAQAVTGYDIARRLIDAADPNIPGYSSAWARLMATARVQNVERVEIDLKHPHVIPEALLVMSLDRQASFGTSANEGASASFGPFTVHTQDDKQVRYVRNTRLPVSQRAKIAELVERTFDDPKKALIALKRGELDAIDYVFPGDLSELQSEEGIVTQAYDLAMTHLLVPAKPHPYMKARNFRRALLSALNREQILEQAILRGSVPAGCRVISGPFLAPVAENDPRAYGYDDKVPPRPNDARLALALRLLSEQEFKAEALRTSTTAPKLEPIVLGHPADEISRIACRAIQQQWKIAGIESQLIEFQPGVFEDPDNKCHLIYQQAALWEPLVDARALLTTPGVTPYVTPHITFKLQQIDAVRNWIDARGRLKELHSFVAEELPVLPLWQTVDYFAYRKRVQGIEPGIVRLYQDVESWQFAGQTEVVAKPSANETLSRNKR